MRADNQVRLERLLARHPSAELVGADSGRPALVRRDEVLVTAGDASAADDRLRRWVDQREDLVEAEVSRFRLRTTSRVDLCHLVSDVAGPTRAADPVGADPGTSPAGGLAVSVNHLLRGEPSYSGGPFDAPRAYTPPPVVVAQRTAERPAMPSGRRITIGVLDTGIDPHPWFGATDWFADCGAEAREVLDADLDLVLDSEAGHGTFVAGLLARNAPQAVLRIERVLGSDGVCDELELIQGLTRMSYRATARGERIDLVNLSLGCYTFDDRPSAVLTRTLARLGRSTVLVAAAGNNRQDRPFWPAALKNVVAVGALSADGADRAEYSNHGWWVDACAIGTDVASSFVSFSAQGQRFEGYARWSGTSFATPVVTGAIAAMAMEEGIDVADAADRLLDPATNLTHPELGVRVRPGKSALASAG